MLCGCTSWQSAASSVSRDKIPCDTKVTDIISLVLSLHFLVFLSLLCASPANEELSYVSATSKESGGGKKRDFP